MVDHDRDGSPEWKEQSMGELLPPGAACRWNGVREDNPARAGEKGCENCGDKCLNKWKSATISTKELPREYSENECTENQSCPTDAVWANTANQEGENEATTDDTDENGDESDPELERGSRFEREVPNPLDDAEVDDLDGDQANHEAHGPVFLSIR